MILLLFIISLVGLDFYPGTADIFREGKIRYALILGALFLFCHLKKKFGVGFSLFVSYGAVFSIFTNYPLIGFYSTFLLIAVPLIASVAIDKLGMEAVRKTLIFVGVLQSAIGILQFFGLHLIFQPFYNSCLIDYNCDKFEVVGTLGQHTVLGSFLALCLAPALWSRAWVSSALMIICILLTRSSMSIGAMIVVIGLFLCYQMKPKAMFYFWSVVGLLLLAGWYFLPDLYFHQTRHSLFKLLGRDKIWPIAYGLIPSAPIFGHGAGYWAEWSATKLGTTFGTIWDKVHSDPLQMLVEQGALGAMACLYAAIEFIKSFRFTWMHAIVVGMLVNSLANFPFHLMGHAMVFCLAWTLSIKQSQEPRMVL